MVDTLTTQAVWDEIEKQIFAVVGMVSAKNEARTAGIVYIVQNRKLYFASVADAWKVRHILHNPHISVTIPIAKRAPLMPWIKIPAATITFSGEARELDAAEITDTVKAAVFKGLVDDPSQRKPYTVIEITPHGHFITYGVGVPLLTMRDTEAARGRVPVA